MSFQVRNPISGITVEFVSAPNPAGDGELIAATVDTLTYKAPDGSTGSEITIANGETKIIPDGTDATMYVLASRTSADDLSGTSVIIVSAIKSTYDRLVETQDAISKVLEAQQLGRGDANVLRANLAELHSKEKQLLAQVSRESGDRPGSAVPDMTGNF